MADKSIGPGTVLAGRYRLEDLLTDTAGAGFWRAVDQVLGRSVAVHVVDAGDPRAPALLDAARTSATVPDPHFLQVLDAATEDGVAYVVNEWGSGVSLDRMLADGPLSADRAAWLVRETAEAITVAHRHGIAHGRLLPENVMVSEAGAVKLIGFVVDAILIGRSRPQEPGTPPLSDHESDVVNLAALLYAALVGRWPGFPGSRLPEAPRDNGRPLRPRQVRAGVPRALDTICDQVLGGSESGRDLRIESASELCRALADFVGDPSGVAPPGYDRQAVLAGDDPPVGPDLAHDPERTREHPTLGAQAARADASRLDSPPPVAAAFSAQPARPAPTKPGATATRPADGGRSNWGWLRLAAVVAATLLLVVAVVVAFALGRGTGANRQPGRDSTPAGTSSAATLRSLPVASVRDFDPQGDPPQENPELARLAADGDPRTAWRTVTYFNDPRLGRLKDGVGLLVDLGRPRSVAEVDLTLIGRPTSLDILAAPGATAPPSGTAGLRTVASAARSGPRANLPFNTPVTARYLVVWLTSLPPVGDGYQGQIAEIVVRG